MPIIGGIPAARYFVPFDGYVPIPTAGIFDTPAVCVQINEIWAGYVYGAVYALYQPDLWDGSEAESDAALTEVRKLLDTLLIQFDCPPCDPEPTEPEPTEPEPTNNQALATVGSLGLSIQELEMLIMNSIVDIRCNPTTGAWEVLRFGCCEYEEISCQPQNTWNRGSTGGTIIDQILAMDDHTLNQSPALSFPALPEAAISGDFAQPGISQCAKATAFADFIILYTTELSEAMEDFWDNVGIGLTIFGALASFVSPTVGILVGDAAGLALEIMNDMPQEDLAAIQAWALAGSTREEIACAVMSAFYDTQDVSQVELKRAWAAIENELPNPVNPAIFNAGKFIDANGFADFIASEAAVGQCVCSDLLPAGYSPEVPSGDLRIDFYSLVKVADPGNLNGTPYNFSTNFDQPWDGQQGQLWNDLFRTVDLGDANNAQHCWVGAAFEVSQAATLTQFRQKYFLDVAATIGYAEVWTWDSVAETWEHVGTGSSLSGSAGAHNDAIALSSATNVTWVLLAFKFASPTGQTPGNAFFTDIEFSGSFPGGSFSDMPHGELFSAQ